MLDCTFIFRVAYVLAYLFCVAIVTPQDLAKLSHLSRLSGLGLLLCRLRRNK